MIEKFFKKFNKPLIFKNGILKQGENNYLPLTKIYFFIETHSMKIEEVGNSWIVDRIDIEKKFKGYFYCQPNSLLNTLENDFPNDIMIVGDNRNKQYQIKGVSIEKTLEHFDENNSYNISRFSASSLEIINLK